MFSGGGERAHWEQRVNVFPTNVPSHPHKTSVNSLFSGI